LKFLIKINLYFEEYEMLFMPKKIFKLNDEYIIGALGKRVYIHTC